MNIRLTESDFDLLRWINKFGFVTVEQIGLYFGTTVWAAYKRARRLCVNKYLSYERVVNELGVYFVTYRGAQISGSPLPALRTVPLSTYRHDLLVIDLSLELVKRFKGIYVSERELRHEQGKDAFGAKTHISDGDLVLDDKRIAIELELSKKSKRRREKIFGHYFKQFHYKEIWYFCGNEEVKRQLEPFLKRMHWLRIYLLGEFLSSKNNKNEVVNEPN